MNKQYIEAFKLAFTTGASFFGSRALSKSDAVQKIGADKYPGIAPAGATTALFAASVKFGKSIKDNSIRTGAQAGFGAAALVSILNIPKVKENMPATVQTLLSGSGAVDGQTVTTEQLEQVMNNEVQKRVRETLSQIEFTEPEQQQLAGESDSVTQQDLVDAEDTADVFDLSGNYGDEIFST
ncbi:hypothetical protein [Leptospira bouyouniensis]|uniref:Uncharacterized protein n=1 Tax=Leptospira bouyouniensis TaxID=2484911 RepID=A0ABY2LD40_9LEPT|nr:hypothetical protein [Leptospira bouyouniensis]TGK53227.1 hypothetical protein EHQ10_05660 [Leptospira bouyouniensis]